MTPRKQPEPPPPGQFIRSKNGTPARLVKTSNYDEHDEWLYRLDYGRVTGKSLWSIAQLLGQKCTFLDERPDDLPERLEIVS